MGWIKQLFGRRGPAMPADPAAFREALFAQMMQGVTADLVQVCRKNQDFIRQHFKAWSQVPKEIRENPAALEQYVNCVFTLVNVFSQGLHDSSLGQAMMKPGPSPMDAAEKLLADARRAQDEDEPERAAELLEQIPAALEGLIGPGAEEMRCYVRGTQATLHFDYGRMAQAQPLMEQTLADCERRQDRVGRIIWHQNLYQLQRYLGNGSAAAEHAHRAAQLMAASEPPEAVSLWHRRATRAAKGEPLVRLQAHLPQGVFEMDELPAAPMTSAKFSFERNRPQLGGASRKMAKGKKLESAGQLQAALAEFTAAAAIDPFDPDPPYQCGATLLSLGQYPQAAEAFRRTEALAPGWFHCRFDLWLAEEMAAGFLDHAALETIWQLENNVLTGAAAVTACTRLIEAYPDLAVAHLHLALAGMALQERPAALTAAQAGLACVQEQDIETRLLMAAYAAAGKSVRERRGWLERAAALDGHRATAAGARLILLAEAG